MTSSTTSPIIRIGARLAGTVTATALTLTLAPVASAGAAPGDGIRERQLDRITEKVHRRGAIGVTAELVTPDGTWRGAAGRGERNPRLPAREDARFRAASVSKQLVTVLALQQVEKGAWSLDTTLVEVLPGLWPAREDATLRQLLSHTSGLPDYLIALVADADTTPRFRDAISRERTDRELVEVAKALPAPEPGAFTYANTNFVVVGMMLEKATGRSLRALVRERVFEPATMSQSSWPTNRAMPRPRLKEYARLYGDIVSLASFQPSMFSGAGALLTTARDLNRFQLALADGVLVGRSLVKRMRAVVSGGAATGLEYGLGSYRLPDPCRPGRYVHGHDGGSWGTFTLSYASPGGDRRVAVSMTGRDYDGRTGAVTALSELAVKALAQTCGGTPTTPTKTGSTAPRTAAPVG